MAHPISYTEGAASWTQQAGDTYDVTGVDTRGRRFKLSTPAWWHANGINLYRGSVWLVRDGKRYLIRRTGW